MKKRILFIVQLPPPVHGAAVINQLIVDSAGIHSKYHTSVLPLKFVTEVSHIRRFSVKKIFLMIAFVFRLVYRLITFRPHLVYFTISPQGNSFYRDALFIFFIKLFRARLVYHLHSRGIQQGMARSGWVKKIYRFVFRNAYIISLSQLLSNEFAGLPYKEIFLLPNGIPDNEPGPGLRQENPLRILFLSNLFEAKGVFVFLDALKLLVENGTRFEAEMAGVEGDVSIVELEKYIVKNGLSEYVRLSGPVYGDRKKEALTKAAIFCMPSLDEAFPLVILEAMQASLCIVASRVGAIPDMINEGENGFLCNPGNEKEFSEAMTLLIKDAALRQRISENAKAIFKEKFTETVFRSRLQNIIDRLLQ